MYLTDTHPRIEKIRNLMFRNMTPEQGFERTLKLSDWAIRMSKKAITQAHPHLSKKERDVLFVEIHYGKTLARKVQKYLEKLEREGH